MKKYAAIIAVSVAVVLVSVCLYFVCLQLRPYENYSEVLGFTEPIYYYGYKSIVDKFGEPKKIEKYDKCFEVHYDEFVFAFRGSYEPGDFMNVYVTSNKYKFGRNKICVGSTKEEVLWAYRHVRRSPDEGYHFIDNDYFITFNFDENDCVDGIRILENPPT